ncbi:MAG: antA/AntB antirepressor family protein [Ruminococcus sp.]|uniref:antA/AntB antirepressor family protein n=1 Tax=Ruminococcus sp. TaxID=41978 RepID=UPI0025DA413D|nr:antA/AntB antirepressor family protein [Ruminococcus sp.]MCR5540890.1 antA/AntB antirepressor family protein [Ruminococcus sp.]
MNEITIAVNVDNDKPTVSGQELHEALMIDTPYKKWFDRMVGYGFTEGTDFWTFLSQSTGGRPPVDHQLTIDMAKELCMIQRTEIGKRCREYFLNLERQWNSPDAVMVRAL